MANKKRYEIVGVGARARMFIDAATETFADHASWSPASHQPEAGRALRAYLKGKALATPVVYAVDQFDEMVSAAKPDTIIVTTVDATHHTYPCRGMELGCDVVREKPMTVGRYDPRRWAEAAMAMGVGYAVLIAEHHGGFCLFDSKLTNYGRIDLLVFDFSYYDFLGQRWGAEELVAMIRSLQPDIVLNDRLSNAFAGHMKSETPPPWSGDFDMWELNMPHGDMLHAYGQRVSWDLWITENNGWSSHEGDYENKRPADEIPTLVNCVSNSGSLTFNFAPSARGELLEGSIALRHAAGDWLTRNQESIRGCYAASLERLDWGRWTLSEDGRALYAHVTEQPMGHLALRGLRGKVRNPRLFASGHEAAIGDFWNPNAQSFGQPDDTFFNIRRPIQATDRMPDRADTVIAMDVVSRKEQDEGGRRSRSIRKRGECFSRAFDCFAR
ncbi:MAG: alpha-L-fucosidase [Planctomycetota bacterium]